MVIHHGCAPISNQFSHGNQRSIIQHFRSEIPPTLVKPQQPVEQFQILNLGYVAGQDLVKMMMGVDQPRKNNHPVCLNDCCISRRNASADFLDETVFNIEVTVFKDLVRLIHGHHERCVSNQGFSHRSSRSYGLPKDSGSPTWLLLLLMVTSTSTPIVKR